MLLHVGEARKHPGEEYPFSFEIPAAELGDTASLPWKDSPVEIRGSYMYDGVGTLLRGTIHTEGRYECCRCLEEVRIQRSASIHETYVSADRASESNADTSVYDGETIDLHELVRELLIASEPVKVLCREDCRGLCATCGKNLNEGPCDCSKEEPDPRWDALKAFTGKGTSASKEVR